MNENKFPLVITAIVYVAALLWVVPKVLSGMSLLFLLPLLLLLFLPFILSLGSKLRPYWMILGLASTISMGEIDYVMLNQLQLSYVVNGLFFALLAIEIAMHKTKSGGMILSPAGKLMAVYVAASTLRFLIDRPGSAQTGGAGGLGQALPYVLAGWFFLSMATIADRFRMDSKQMKVLWICCIVGGVGIVMNNIERIQMMTPVNLFGRFGAWFFGFLALCRVMEGFVAKRRSFLQLTLITAGILIAGVFSANRMTMVYTTAAAGVVFWMYQRTRSYLKILMAGGVLALGLAFAMPQHIPRSAIRTLSLVMPKELQTSLAEAHSFGGEIGWESKWRTTLNRIAFKQVMQKPLFGQGFTFSFDEIYYAAVLSRGAGGHFNVDAEEFGGLTVGRSYHNGIFSMAVNVGIPVTICFIIATIIIYKRFVFYSLRLPPGLQKQFCVMLSAVFVCAVLKMLTNGGGRDIFNMSIMMGVMYGVLKLPVEDVARLESVETVPESEPTGDAGAVPAAS